MNEQDDEPEPDDPLTDEEVKTAVAELGAAYSRSQQSYDSSVRTIAAGAVAITASLVAALESAGWSGGLAVVSSLLSLTANLGSYWTAQFDIGKRRDRAWEYDRAGIEGDRWKTFTTGLNVTAGLMLIAAGCSLVIFVISHT